jgi:hypothetical protein
MSTKTYKQAIRETREKIIPESYCPPNALLKKEQEEEPKKLNTTMFDLRQFNCNY